MRVSRIFSSTPLVENCQLALDARSTHYLVNVLRAKAGNELVLFDGSGSDFAAKIVSCNRKQLLVDVGVPLTTVPESPLHTTLALSITKGERMDWAIQKATELGVNLIQPVFSAHSDIKLSGQRLEKKSQHWRNVAISACEQSGRSVVPFIEPLCSLSDWLAPADNTLQMICNGSGQAIADIEQTPDRVSILIGPEGGFSSEEIEMAVANKFRETRLGPRTLRAETAPVAALSLVQSRWGDLL